MTAGTGNTNTPSPGQVPSVPCWRCRDRRLLLGRPLVMGILNVTPDSFSDGGRHHAFEAAVAHGRSLAAAGADIIDIGGESTRPGAQPVSRDEEAARVVPVIRALAQATPVPLSVDTRHAAVARAALAAGASIVNDVEGLVDPEMASAVREAGAGAVVMHMQGAPQTMQQAPVYDDVVEEVYAWLLGRVAALTAAGLDAATLVIDPGIGFGKTREHNLALLGSLRRFAGMGPPVLVGLSRKRMVGEITGAPVEDRLAGSLAGLVWCVWQGASILRVHDVRESVAALRMATALAARQPEAG
ncbi:MAG: dihydropteroate synthase [Lentisphaerae bacterium]|nr:dihydropteroate synthase [Lentisphaerota bacterium]